MSMRLKNLFSSVWPRYLISYAGVLALLFSGVALYMNQSYAATVRENIIDSNINKLASVRAQTEAYFQTMIGIANQISLSPDMQPFRLLDDPVQAFRMRDQLLPYTLTIGFTNHLFLMFEQDDYLYSSATSVPLSLFLNQLMRFERLSPETLRGHLKNPATLRIVPAQKVQSALLDGDSARIVTVIVSLGVGQSQKTGCLIFMIKESQFQQLFADEIEEPRASFIFMGDETLAMANGLGIPEDVARAAARNAADFGAADLQAGGVKHLLIAQHGTRPALTYVTVIPEETVRRGTLRARMGFFLFLFALSFVALLLTAVLSRRHAKPIRALRSFFGPGEPAENELTAIRSGIEALVGRNEALHTRLDQSLPAQKSDFVVSFVKGRYGARESAVAAATAAGMAIDRQFFLVALVTARRTETEPLSIELLMARGGDGVFGYGAELVVREQLLFALFADSAAALEAWAERVLASPGGARNACVTVAVSSPASDFEKAGAAYLEASAAYDNRFVMGVDRVLRFLDISGAAKGVVPFTRVYLDGFRKAMRAGDPRALNERIDELFRYLGNSGMSLFAFRIAYNSVIDALLSEDIGGADAALDAMRVYDVFSLSDCRSIADLDGILRKLCGDILARRTEAEETHPVIAEALACMRARFDDPNLSLRAIAETLGISAGRLSIDFKERMGMSPSDYLALLRMEKAKDLLSGSDMPIKDVGAAVGYYDTSAFIRRFKQHLAETPAQYRQRARGAAE